MHYSEQCIFCIIAGAQLQSSVERPCPGETVTFTCTVRSTAHNWNIQSLGITRSLIPVSQRDGVISDPPFEFNVTEVVPGTSITSTATVNVTANQNGTLVVCQDGNLVLPDQSTTINLRGEHVIFELDQTVDCWYLHNLCINSYLHGVRFLYRYSYPVFPRLSLYTIQYQLPWVPWSYDELLQEIIVWLDGKRTIDSNNKKPHFSVIVGVEMREGLHANGISVLWALSIEHFKNWLTELQVKLWHMPYVHLPDCLHYRSIGMSTHKWHHSDKTRSTWFCTRHTVIIIRVKLCFLFKLRI